MVLLQERLKIEIRHKLILMRHVTSLQEQLKARRDIAPDTLAAPTADADSLNESHGEVIAEARKMKNLVSIATQTDMELNLSKYERDLQAAGRAVR